MVSCTTCSVSGKVTLAEDQAASAKMAAEETETPPPTPTADTVAAKAWQVPSKVSVT